MADSQPAKKRRVKNPETFRERALKSAEADNKVKPAKRIKSAGGRATSPARKQFGRAYGSKAVKPFRKPLSRVGKIIFPTYFRNSWQELKLVSWPNWQESRRLTFAVIVFAVIFGAAIAGVDWALNKVFKELLLR